MKNEDLKKKYNEIFKAGAYQNYFTFNSHDIWKGILDSLEDWSNLEVLDLGCGEGQLTSMVAFAGAKSVHSIDNSEEALKIASERIKLDNISFELVDGKDVKGKFDVVVMAGVLEHMDSPYDLLQKLIDKNLKKGGLIISASPSFMNPRGYVWMTLQILLDVPMSLSDIHFFSPSDFYKFGKQNDMEVQTTTISHDWGGGAKTLLDFKKRLVNALNDADLPNNKVDDFLDWLKDALNYYDHNDLSGAIMISKFMTNKL